MNRSKKLKVKSKKYRRILIVRLDRIGDVVLSTPVIKALKEANPGSVISFMSSPHAKDILESNPALDEVILYDKASAEKGILGNLKFILRLRKKKFDLAVVLHPTVRSHIVTALAGIPRRIGYDRKWGFLLTTKVPHTKEFGLKHEIDYTLDILRYIGIEPRDKSLYIGVNERSERKVDELFRQSGIGKDDLCVAVNPGASCASKRWGAAKFAEVAGRLAAKYGARIVIVAGESDKSLGDEVAALLEGGCVNLSGRTTVADLASVLRRVRLFVSNDSGPVHIACAVGTPVIAIFGRSDRGLSPRRWGPTGGRDVVLYKDAGCDECLAHNCKRGFACLEAITVDEVVAAAGRILG